ncbi:uncharacterized protein LOC120083950 [Benincasa hispida]|uniref:uncharacterized protein LOC120083950 n=1 Tax=Benincasa hispida TaxID=102211 RepID=UPI001901AEFB|nr:uncharacterized protein LOC120083950 [Benincasa hispida]
MRCPEEQKLQCAAFVLINNAKRWWHSAERMIEASGGQATWNQFKERFYEKYFSAHVRYNKQAEFMNLKQGTMTIEEYEEEFDKLSCFAPDLVSNEEKRCKQTWHTTDQCPSSSSGSAGGQPPSLHQGSSSRQQQQGRVYATSRREAEHSGTVVTLSTLSGEIMVASEKIKACQLEIANHTIDITLIVLYMRDFDVILGMDWEASFKFKRARTVVLPKVISVVKAKRLINQGVWSILASVVDTREIKIALISEPIMRYYPDVFLEELRGLPPLREIDFANELESDTIPISKASYRMALAELKELKVQL